LLIALAYSAVYPITNLIGGTIGFLGLGLTYPFLFLAWCAGMVIVGVFGTESVYLIGAYIAVVFQVLLCMLAWELSKVFFSAIKKWKIKNVFQ
jgi:hypothetical protein